jgi:hypothetical protein
MYPRRLKLCYDLSEWSGSNGEENSTPHRWQPSECVAYRTLAGNEALA